MILKLMIRVLQIVFLVKIKVCNSFHIFLGGKIINSIRWKIEYLKNLYFNLKYLPYEQAVHVPIKWGRNIKILQLRKGQIKIENIIGLYQIMISNDPPQFYFPDRGQTTLLVKEEGELVFKGRARIGKGSTLRCDENSKIIFGDDFLCSKDVFIRSNNLVSFGQSCRVGLGVIMNSTNGHWVKRNDRLSEPSMPIKLGDKVWIGSRCIIGKGVEISDHCIVGQGSVVLHKKFTNPYSIIHGIAASEGVGRYERLDF